MNIFKNILTVVSIVALIYCIYLQQSSNKRFNSIQNQVIETQQELDNYKNEIQINNIKLVQELTENQNKKMDELRDAINKVDNNHNAVVYVNDRLHETIRTNQSSSNTIDSATKDEYIKTLSELLIESTNLLRESSKAADEATETAIVYKDILDNNYQISQKYNQELNPELEKQN